MAGQGDKTVDDDAGSTASFEEIAFKRALLPMDDQSPVIEQASQDTPKPDVLYVLRYLDLNGRVLKSRESVAPFKEIPGYRAKYSESATRRALKPVLEIVTKVSAHYDAEYPDSSESDDDDFAKQTTDIIQTQMIIHSLHLINALRATVAYDPDVDLLRESVSIDAPYRVIVHHRKALERYKFHQPAGHSSEYARVTAKHIDVLLSFIEEGIHPPGGRTVPT